MWSKKLSQVQSDSDKKAVMGEKYKAAFAESLQQPAEFWKAQADSIDWFRKPENILSRGENGNDVWFADGELNTAHIALDFHVDNGRADQPALIYDSPVTNTIQTYTYRELRDNVALFAGALENLGVVKGDRVIIYMPMIPEAAIAMLACARIGAVHSVVFGGFAHGSWRRELMILNLGFCCLLPAVLSSRTRLRTNRLLMKRLNSHLTSRKPASSFSARNARLRWVHAILIGIRR